MPIIRRKRTNVSSSRLNEVEAKGVANLCFSEDLSWFQGNIQSDEDSSSYSILGEIVIPEKSTNVSNNNNEGEENKPPHTSPLDPIQNEEFYKVTLIDHFSGQSYPLPKIYLNGSQISSEGVIGNNSILHFVDPDDTQEEINFRVNTVHKGQKADIMIQRCLGSPTLVGKKCVVYSGPIRIAFVEVTDNGKTWCL